jgi:hypothetical protein
MQDYIVNYREIIVRIKTVSQSKIDEENKDIFSQIHYVILIHVYQIHVYPMVHVIHHYLQKIIHVHALNNIQVNIVNQI